MYVPGHGCLLQVPISVGFPRLQYFGSRTLLVSMDLPPKKYIYHFMWNGAKIQTSTNNTKVVYLPKFHGERDKLPYESIVLWVHWALFGGNRDSLQSL